MQQRVEILKTLYKGADILILDEPTAVLTPQEIVELMKTMRHLIEEGKTIIIITHKLKEIKAASDTCTIICRGKYLDTVKVKNTTESQLATLMVGHEVNLVVEKQEAKPGEIIFTVDNIYAENERKIDALKGLSFEIRKGEILGIAGIDGNGQKELIEAITGFIKVKKGTIRINGKEIQNTSPRNIIESGISTIPEDRHKQGLVLEFTVDENAILNKYRMPPFSKSGFISKVISKQFTKELIKEYDIRPVDCGALQIGNLSGGNQQKLIIGREVSNEPLLLIAVQPTRGLDVGAIENVHKSLIRERDKGRAILLISYELDEVMNVSDNITVIYEGGIQGNYKQGTVNEDTIGLLMAGGRLHV